MAVPIGEFAIEEITKYNVAHDLVVGKVRYSHTEQLGDRQVIQHLVVTARVTVPSSATIEELHEALFRKAAEMLGHTSEAFAGKSARELSSLQAEHQRRLNAPPDLKVNWPT